MESDQTDTTAVKGTSFFRGSSLLLAGRIISLIVNFVAQVIIVRYLSKSSYGSYAYALGIATLVSLVAGMGFQTTVARFTPIYRAEKDYSRMFGSLVFMVGTIIGVSSAIIAGFYGFKGLLGDTLFSEPTAFAVMFILIYFIPVNALDRFLENTVAVFAGARSIFIRRHLFGPFLKLAAVLLVIALSGNERMLAIFFLVASILGVLLYLSLLFQVLYRDGLLKQFKIKALEIPTGRLLRFGIPIMISNLNVAVPISINLVLLGLLHGSEGVAEFRAVIPLAELNKAVSRNFTLLFIPYAAKLLAENNQQGIEVLLQKTIVWISILTFPLFLLCFALATPLVTLIFGVKYASSGIVLAILSLGFFLHAILGFCAHILKVFDKLRVLVTIEVFATLLIVGLAFWWIPEKGAIGAALAIAVGGVFQSLVIFFAMTRTIGLRVFTRQSLRLYVYVVVCTVLSCIVHNCWSPNMFFSFLVAAVFGIGVVVLNRDLLSLQGIFPELARIPFLRKLIK